MTDGSSVDWPIEIDGVIEAVIATPTSDERWNIAALGLHEGHPVTARTWGRTRTWRSFHREGTGVVQFIDDPVRFVEAALAPVESDDPVLEAAAAWVRVTVDSLATGREAGTVWEDWTVVPVEVEVRRRTIPTIDRGFNAVIEASVAASRLGVPAYEEDRLRDRLDQFEDVVRRCGGDRDREAMERIRHFVADP